MKLLGEDFSGGLFRRGYWPSNPTGLWYSLARGGGADGLHQVLQGAFVLAFILLVKAEPSVTPASYQGGTRLDLPGLAHRRRGWPTGWQACAAAFRRRC